MNGYADLFNAPARDDYETVLRGSYNWIEAFIKARGYSPTILEIHQARGLSYEMARRQVLAMERRGWIAPRYGLMRNIQLKGMG